MRLSRARYSVRALGRSVRLRCPECGQGDIFERGLHMHPLCPYCGVRFERAPGEALGAAYLIGALTLLTAPIGFWIVDAAFDADPTPYITLWIVVTIVIDLLLYRRARGLWIGVLYLTGGVYADPDYEREFLAPGVRTTEHERR